MLWNRMIFQAQFLPLLLRLTCVVEFNLPRRISTEPADQQNKGDKAAKDGCSTLERQVHSTLLKSIMRPIKRLCLQRGRIFT